MMALTVTQDTPLARGIARRAADILAVRPGAPRDAVVEQMLAEDGRTPEWADLYRQTVTDVLLGHRVGPDFELDGDPARAVVA